MRADWELVKLGFVCDIQNVFAFDSKLFNNEGKGLPLIRIRDIKRGHSETFTTEKCDEAYVVKDGEYLIGMDGEFNIGQWKSENALLNQRVCKLLPSSKVLPRLIYYYIPKALKDIEAKTAYATVKHLSSKQIKEISIPNLPLPEQQRIVDILDQEFAKIDALKANAEKSLQAAKDLYAECLNSSLAFKDGWKTKTLDKVCSKITDGTHNSPPNTAQGEFKYITAKNIKPWGLDLTDITFVSAEVHRDIFSRCNPFKGDVLYIKDGATTGIAILNPLEEEFSLLSSVALLKPLDTEITSKYLCYAMNSPKMYAFVREKMDGAAITRITLKKIKEFPISFPPLEEQDIITARLDDLNDKCQTLQENYQKTLTLCDDLKQALLRKAFNGEL